MTLLAGAKGCEAFMKNHHIAMVIPPGTAHVYPVLGLCAELVKRGYKVTVSNDDQHANLIHSLGAEPVISRPPAIDGALAPASRSDWWTVFSTVHFPWLINNAASTIEQSSEFYLKHPPDTVLYDSLAYAGRILAKRFNAHAIQINPHFAHYNRSIHWKEGVCCNPQPMMEFARKLDEFLGRHGIDEGDNLWHVEDLNICFVPKEFQYCSDSFDRRFCFVGRCLRRPFAKKWKNRSEGRPIVLVSDKTYSADYRYFRELAESLADEKFHIIVSVSEQIPESAMESLPQNCEINRLASNLEILPHVSLVICQAGMGITLEALYNGVPVIALPAHPFYEEVAYRVEELKVGRCLERSELTGDMIRTNVKEVWEDLTMRGRAKEIQTVFRTSSGAAAAMAADKIDAILGRRRMI
jgi:MGT family glycosyltransferase